MTQRPRPGAPRWGASAVRGSSAHHLADQRPDTWSDPLPVPGIVGLILTGYLDTEIRSRTVDAPPGDRFRWTFGPGIERTEPLRTAPPAARAAIAELPDNDGYRISLGWMDGDRRHHLAPGRASLAGYVTGRTHTTDTDELIRTAAGLGSALRELRGIGTQGAADLPAPAGPTRLAHWLRTGDGPWAAAEMHDLLTSELGPGRVEEIIGWVEDLATDHLVHGRAGLTTIVVPESDTPAALLIGDDIARGPRDFDLSWVLGELLIADHLADYAGPADQRRQRELIAECRDAVLQAYGPTNDLILAGRTTTLRVLLELHDSAAHQDRMLTDLALHAPELVDSAR